MELKEFITSVLVDVCEAVNDAKRATKGSIIAPGPNDGLIGEETRLVNFEVSVVVTDSIEGRGGGKIQVWSIGASGEALAARETINMNKISFQVPVLYSTSND
jgi:hypothetical protein